MKRTCAVAFAIWISLWSIGLGDDAEVQPFEPRITRALDQASGIQAEMLLARDSNRRLDALRIVLTNTSRDRDVTIKLNDYRPAAFSISIHDETGKKLSTPSKELSFHGQTYSSLTIKKSSSREWRIPIAELLINKQAFERVPKGRVFSGIIFLYTFDPTDSESFKVVQIHLYDTDVSFTSK